MGAVRLIAAMPAHLHTCRVGSSYLWNSLFIYGRHNSPTRPWIRHHRVLGGTFPRTDSGGLLQSLTSIRRDLRALVQARDYAQIDAYYDALEQRDWADTEDPGAPYFEAANSGTLFDYSMVPFQDAAAFLQDWIAASRLVPRPSGAGQFLFWPRRRHPGIRLGRQRDAGPLAGRRPGLRTRRRRAGAGDGAVAAPDRGLRDDDADVRAFPGTILAAPAVPGQRAGNHHARGHRRAGHDGRRAGPSGRAGRATPDA